MIGCSVFLIKPSSNPPTRTRHHEAVRDVINGLAALNDTERHEVVGSPIRLAATQMWHRFTRHRVGTNSAYCETRPGISALIAR